MPRLIAIAICGLLGLTFATGARAAPAQTDAFTQVFGKCGDTCTIKYNIGGQVQKFQEAARAVEAGAKKLIVIDGPCISACAIFADMARSRVCITNRARFGFHKASLFAVHASAAGAKPRMEFIGRHDPPHSEDINGWVKNNGGFPISGLKFMNNKAAGDFFKRCT